MMENRRKLALWSLSALLVFLLAMDYTYAWPRYLHFNLGEKQQIQLGGKDYLIELRSVEYKHEPNNHKPAAIGSQTLTEARVTITVNGQQVLLLQRPYQLPVTFMGLRLYVENTRRWVKEAGPFQAIDIFPKEVKLALCAEGDSWGPETMRFPLKEYRWRSSMYNNTWSSLVPGSQVYYHRGEDFGAIPDLFDVQACLEGQIKASPLPDGDGASNEIIVDHSLDFTYRISHMNIGHVQSTSSEGAQVKAGQLLAKSGNTYQGVAKQKDPHLHIDFTYQGEPVSTYPYLVEAYLRDYPDHVLAVAGGYSYAMAGQQVALDATRSVARNGHEITSYTWILPDGEIVNEATTQVSFDRPGKYAIELIVKTHTGEEDRDYLHVSVFDKQKNPTDFLGYFYHYPVRGAKAGKEIAIWRAAKVKTPIDIDFGDGSKASAVGLITNHTYHEPGVYTVTMTTATHAERPGIAKMKIVIEK